MKYYRISEEQIKNLLAYLCEKPFKEVSAGIYDLSRLEELPEGSNGILKLEEGKK